MDRTAIAAVAGVVSSVTSQRKAATAARTLADDPEATMDDLRAELRAASLRLETHAYLAEAVLLLRQE